MATGDIGAVIDSGVFDAVRGTNKSVVHVSGDVYAIAYTGPDNDGWLCTLSIDSAGNISAVIDTLEFDNADGGTPCLIHISGNIFAIAYWKVALDDGIVVTVNIDNTGNIGAAVIDTLTFDAVRGRAPDIIHVSGDIYAIAYRGPDDDGWLCTVNIDNLGNIGAVIDTLEFDAVYGSAASIIHISGDIYAIAYTGPDDDGWLCTVNIDNLGNIGAAVIDTLEYDNTWSNDQRIVPVAGDIYAIAYTRWTDPGRLCTVDIDNTGNIGAAVIDSVDFEPATGIRISIVHVSSNVFAAAYQGPDSDGWLKTLSVADDGTIGAVIDSLEFDTDYCDYPHIIHVAGNVYAIAYTSALFATGSIKTVDVESVVLPTVTTNSATAITANTATLNGTLDDDGGEACEYRFRYRKVGGAYSYTAWANSKVTNDTFYEDIIGLDPNTTYQFNAQAKNSAGESDWGNELEFTTLALPIVITDPATNIEKTSSTLNGTLDDDGGEACDCGFEWGDTPAYGHITPTQSRTTGLTFAQTIIGLDPNKTYHFIAFATNSAGTSYGADRTFSNVKGNPNVDQLMYQHVERMRRY